METQEPNLIEYLWARTCEEEHLDATLVRDKSLFLAGAQSVLMVLVAASGDEEESPCTPYEALVGMLDDIETAYNEFQVPAEGALS